MSEKKDTPKSIDIYECPTRNAGFKSCRCDNKCGKCGFGKHTAVHGPVLGQPVGSKPWGHQFEDRTTTPVR